MSAIQQTIQMELSGRGNGWTTISDVLVTEPIAMQRGMGSGAVRDRVAGPGELTFALNNSALNSAHLLGYYSPGNTNCRSGFELGVGVRYRWVFNSVEKIMFTGRVTTIRPVTGVNGPRVTYCTANGYLAQLARAKLSGIPVQINQRSSDVFATMIANMEAQPRSLQIGTGASVFPYALDNTRDESIQALTEAARLAMSEYGYIFEKGDGTLVFEPRTTRAISRTNIATFTGMMFQELDITYDIQRALNFVQVINHPKKVDDTATTVLYTLQTAARIAPGESIVRFGPYRDPQQLAARVGGTDMVDPVANTDYEANTAQDGTGTDVTANISIVALFGGNGVSLTITNNGSVDAWIGGDAGLLQVRGKGIYDFENIVSKQEDPVLQTKYGVVEETLDQPYESDSATGNELALYILRTQKQGWANVDRIAFMASTEALREQAFNRDISDRIGLQETVSGVTTVSGGLVPRGYFINGIRTRSIEGVIWVEYILAVADSTSYWFLEITGSSELDSTTVLGFGLVVGHSDVAHGDIAAVSHVDTAHADHTDSTAHVDSSHGDIAHSDAAHGDSAHGDVAHSDVAHVDTAHGDATIHDDHNDQAGGHNDTGGGKTHSDTAHSDVAHSDVAHGDTTGHADAAGGAHTDLGTNGSEFHIDTDNGIDHFDQAHSDTAHSDTAHGDNTHEDFSGHTDTAHSDTAHSDSHTDAAHSDTAHSDVTHVDNSSHGDVAHGDSAHQDTAHGDVEGVSHVDTPHVDAN